MGEVAAASADEADVEPQSALLSAPPNPNAPPSDVDIDGADTEAAAELPSVHDMRLPSEG